MHPAAVNVLIVKLELTKTETNGLLLAGIPVDLVEAGMVLMSIVLAGVGLILTGPVLLVVTGLLITGRCVFGVKPVLLTGRCGADGVLGVEPV